MLHDAHTCSLSLLLEQLKNIPIKDGMYALDNSVQFFCIVDASLLNFVNIMMRFAIELEIS